MEGHMTSMNDSYLFVIISTSMKTSLCQVPIGENKECIRPIPVHLTSYLCLHLTYSEDEAGILLFQHHLLFWIFAPFSSVILGHDLFLPLPYCGKMG